MTSLAGQWGPEPIIDTAGRAIPAAVMKLFLADGTTLATVYVDRARSATVSNPMPTGVLVGSVGTDIFGNGLFFAAPADYVLTISVGGSEVYRSAITVNNDPSSGGGGGTVQTVQPGASVHVDATDPANPIISVPAATSSTSGSLAGADKAKIDALASAAFQASSSFDAAGLAAAAQAASVPRSTAVAKGDLIVATGVGAVSRLAVGTDGYVPIANSGATLGVSWAPTVSATGPGLAAATSTSGLIAIPSQGHQSGPGMIPWHRGVYAAYAGSAPVVVVALGDSEIEIADCYSGVRAKLKAALQPGNRQPDATNAIPYRAVGAIFQNLTFNTTWTGTGTLLTGDTNNLASTGWRGITGYGWGMTDGQSRTTNGAFNPSGITCERVQFRWLAGSAGSSLDLKVDGVTVHTVADASTANTFTTNALTPGLHTVTFFSHGNTVVDGCYFYWGDYTSGVQWWDLGHSGAAVHQILNFPELAAGLTQIAPHLIINEGGGNDRRLGQSASAFQADLITLIGMERTALPGALGAAGVAQLQWQWPNLCGNSGAADFRDVYLPVQQTISVTYGIPLVDVGELIPSLATFPGGGPDTPYGYTVDGEHMSALGTSVVSRLLMGRLFGGDFPVLTAGSVSGAQIAAGAITDANVSSSAAIQFSKIANPTTAVAWSVLFQLNDGTPADGMISMGILNFGAGVLAGIGIYSTTSAAQPGISITYNGGVPALSMGASGASNPDVILSRASAATLTITAASGVVLTGPLAMGTHKVTGLSAATVNGDAVRFEQVSAVGYSGQFSDLSGSIAYSQFPSQATATIIGRSAAGSGVPSALTGATVMTVLSGTATAAFSFGGQLIHNVADPQNGQDAVTLTYLTGHYTTTSSLTAFATMATGTASQLVLGNASLSTAGATTQYIRGDASLSTFNTDVRTNRIDQMTAPTASLSWTSVGSVSIGDGTASHGLISFTVSSGLGAGGSVMNMFAASTDTSPVASLIFISGVGVGLSLGPGGTTNTDITYGRSGTNAATITASSGLTVTGNLTLSAGKNIVTDTTTGMVIWTATTQKGAFFNSTPIVQPVGSTDVLTGLVNLGLRASGANPAFNIGTGAITCGSVTTSAQAAPSATGQLARWDSLYRLLFEHFADTGVGADTTEDVLYTDTLAASQFLTNGDSVEITYGGTVDSNATGTKQIRVYVAGTVVFNSTAVAGTAAGSWSVVVTVTRASSTSLVVTAAYTATGFSAANVAVAAATLTKITGLTLTNTQVVKCSGQNGTTATANRIVASQGVIEYKPAAL